MIYKEYKKLLTNSSRCKCGHLAESHDFLYVQILTLGRFFLEKEEGVLGMCVQRKCTCREWSPHSDWEVRAGAKWRARHPST